MDKNLIIINNNDSLKSWLRFIKSVNGGDLLMISLTVETLSENIMNPLSLEFGYLLGPTLDGKRTFFCNANADFRFQGLSVIGIFGDLVHKWPVNFFKSVLSKMTNPASQFYINSDPSLLRDLLYDDNIRQGFDIRVEGEFGLIPFELEKIDFKNL